MHVHNVLNQQCAFKLWQGTAGIALTQAFMSAKNSWSL